MEPFAECLASLSDPVNRFTSDVLLMDSVWVFEVFATISRILENIRSNPDEDKFRTLKLSNRVISRIINNVPTVLEAFLLMGWEPEAGEDVLVYFCLFSFYLSG